MQNPKENLNEKWLLYLYNTKEKKYNVNNVDSLNKITKHSVFNYVKKTLEILDVINEKEKLDQEILFYVEETLKWCEVAKTGRKSDIKNWKKNNYDLFCHNIGSSQIYLEDNSNKVIATLIKTHGLIGQYIKGEVSLNKNRDLYYLIENKMITKSQLKKVLLILNECVIKAVSSSLYAKIKDDVVRIIDKIIIGDLDEQIDLVKRLNILNNQLSKEEIKYLKSLNKKVKEKVDLVLNNLELWYYDSALNDFSIEEQIKVLLLISKKISNDVEYLTFENLMHSLYLDYKNKKEINIYRKRIIENYLKDITIEDILDDNINPNPHIKYNIKKFDKTLVFNFTFSIQAKKLIEFCEVANNSNSLYQKATYMLYDLFGFRRDDYDRFYNEIDYLNTMNNSLKQKAIILDYMVGKNILDVGPGGGALMDLIEKSNPSLNIYGIDLSQNVIDKLNKKKNEENHLWNIVKGDALKLSKFFKEGTIDTIIYSSIIHELYSYIEYNGQKFNYETIAEALKEAYKILAKKGRIIIRDGIMTSPKEQYRLIEFKNKEDINILNRYCHDFQGRIIKYELINDNTVKMLVNDAMEFLYTYTWGEQSYPLEVKEQFGYFTIDEYVDFIKKNLPDSKIVVSKSFLQDGYEDNLLPKINIYNELGEVVKLPDSTSIIVIEKE